MASLISWARTLFSRYLKVKPKYPDFTKFAIGDRVVISTKKTVLSAPLQPGQRTQLSQGFIAHNDILGRSPLNYVQSHKGPAYRITWPTLEEYVLYTPRKVTPIYSADASLIVSLLDIHVPAHSAENGSRASPLEILEAGTGHGSLTLHLARAIHPANSAPPYLPPPSSSSPSSDSKLEDAQDTAAWEEWRRSRRAVLHSLDIVPSFSQHAKKLVRQFRRGIYAPHVDFHIANIEEWIHTEMIKRRKAFNSSKTSFLSYVILDMPSSYLQIENVTPAMIEGGLLAVFAPSITQIGDCVRIIKEKELPLVMEKTVELGIGISGGRTWDVRLTTRRKSSAYLQKVDEKPQANGEEQNSPESEPESTNSHAEQEGKDMSHVLSQEPDQPVLVCRPKVGDRVFGGGFCGLFKKITPVAS